MSAMPNVLRLIKERSHPLAQNCCFASLTLSDVTRLGISPLAFYCNEAWKPLLEVICEKGGYCWEWIPEQPWISERSTEDWSRPGEVTLTKVKS